MFAIFDFKGSNNKLQSTSLMLEFIYILVTKINSQNECDIYYIMKNLCMKKDHLASLVSPINLGDESL